MTANAVSGVRPSPVLRMALAMSSSCGENSLSAYMSLPAHQSLSKKLVSLCPE